MLFDQVQESIQFIRSKTTLQPRFGIVLGTGLGNLTKEIKVDVEIPYQDIPHFPVSTVQSHQSKLIIGQLGEQIIVAMAGRFHHYEGYSMKEVTFPIRVMKMLGIERLIISNVSGSTNAEIEAGDIVFVKDHINLQAANALRGENDERFGPRFPDMLHTYDVPMIELAEQIAKEHQIKTHQGVYIALQGPNLETPAEYRFLNIIGGDLVGMSTVPEVIVARHMDVPVFVISVVSNKCFPIESIQKTTLESVIEVARVAEPKMTTIVKEMVQRL